MVNLRVPSFSTLLILNPRMYALNFCYNLRLHLNLLSHFRTWKIISAKQALPPSAMQFVAPVVLSILTAAMSVVGAKGL